jgi:hypothetical protein
MKMKARRPRLIVPAAIVAALALGAQPSPAQERNPYRYDLFGAFALVSQDRTELGYDFALAYNVTPEFGVVLDLGRYHRRVEGYADHWVSVVGAGVRLWTPASSKVLGCLQFLVARSSASEFVFQPGFAVDWRLWTHFAFRLGLDLVLSRSDEGKGGFGVHMAIGLAYFFIKRQGAG